MNTNYNIINLNNNVCPNGEYIPSTMEVLSNTDNNCNIIENIDYTNNNNYNDDYNNICIIKKEILKYLDCNEIDLDKYFLVDNMNEYIKKDDINMACILSEIHLILKDTDINNITNEELLNKINDIKKTNITSIPDIKNTDLVLIRDELNNLSNKKQTNYINNTLNVLFEFKKKYFKEQEYMLELEKEYTNKIEINLSNLKIINTMLDKILLNQKNNINHDKNIIEKIKELSKLLKNDSDLNYIKKRYMNQRVLMNEYLLVIRHINCFNNTNLCKICLSNPINYYIIPCGHTACYECLQKQKNIQTIFKCSICRENINNIHKLYI